MQNNAKVVIIGAGIVGCSVAYHLAQQGWKDIVLLDKGPFPNPGGSTGHASNFIFPVDHSKEMTFLTLDSVEQYFLGVVAGHVMAELIDACEKGHDHDNDAVQVKTVYTGLTLDMSFYSRLRKINENSSFSVNG